jgi:hypothetical protein
MALKECKECGHKYSTNGFTCPGCGALNPQIVHASCLMAILSIVGTGIVAYIGYNYFMNAFLKIFGSN